MTITRSEFLKLQIVFYSNTVTFFILAFLKESSSYIELKSSLGLKHTVELKNIFSLCLCLIKNGFIQTKNVGFRDGTQQKFYYFMLFVIF